MILAKVVRIIEIAPIPNADNIVVATVLGWKVVVKKDIFKVGDLAIYFSIGSIPDPEYEYTKFLQGKALYTRKIRGQISQGLLGELNWLTHYGVNITTLVEGNDVTEIMKVKKEILLEETEVYRETGRLPWPAHVPKTNEERLQNIPEILSGIIGKEVIITQKFDGTSTSFVTLNSNFLVCGRNYLLLPDDIHSKHYFEIATHYDLKNKMLALHRNLAIQGEIIGPKIGGNRHKISDLEFYVFNIYDIDNHHYMVYDDVTKITSDLGLKNITLVYRGPFTIEWNSVDALLKLAEQQIYATGTIAEGIVVKLNTHTHISFKVISNAFLLKYRPNATHFI